MRQLCTMIRDVLKIFVCSTANIPGSCYLSASTKSTSSHYQARILSISLVDRNLQISEIISNIYFNLQRRSFFLFLAF